MSFQYKINHLIPGRLRITIPALASLNEHIFLEETLQSVKGMKSVRVIPVIQSVVIEFDVNILNHRQVIGHLNFFFQELTAPVNTPFSVKKDMKHYLLRSAISGAFILVAFLRKNGKSKPDMLDYLVAISTSYTVLTHGENKLGHPDIITGIISMLSLGEKSILQISVVTWLVNLLEIFNDWRRNPAFLYQ